MGWFGGLFGGGSSEADPLAQLDPKVREYLQKESPVKYQSRNEALEVKQKQEEDAIEKHMQQQKELQRQQDQAAERPLVPKESLFQDGRYAHLWKTYRPLHDIEAETKSDHERLMDVLDAFKDRKAQIGRAALENCALEQIEWNGCMRDGSVSSRMTMCHAEMKKFERCYNMQSRLLKALGYMSTYDTLEVHEKVQLHADALYHRMLEQEEAMEKAKAEGLPLPVQTQVPLNAPTSLSTAPTISADDVPEETRKIWDEKLAKLPESERPAEEAAMRADLAAQKDLAVRVKALRAEQAAEREQRKAEGKTTMTDRVSGLFGGK